MGYALKTDGWENHVTGLGTLRDKRQATQFKGALLMGRQELDELYAGDDLIARIVDLPAREMTREWFTLSAGEDGADAAKATMQRLDDLDIQSKTDEAIAWARLHGGALMVLGVDDGQDPSQPLKEDAIRSFRWVTVLDRWDVDVAEKFTDPLAPQFGEPKLYRIATSVNIASTTAGIQPLIHASRVIRFDGARTSRLRRQHLQGWCDSVVTRVYEVVRDFSLGHGGAAHLLSDFSQAVVKIKGLAAMIASDQDGLVLKRLMMMDMARSMVRMVPLDAEMEEFSRQATPVTGLPDLLDRLAQRLSAATEFPVTLLMGQSPAGLNATGASDIRLFYDSMKSRQERELRPRLGRIVQLVLRSQDGPTSGIEPKDWSIEFRPLWQPTEKEQAETRYITAQTDAVYLDRGVVDAAEIAMSRFGGDKWSMETAIDLEGRNEPTPADPDDEPALQASGTGAEPDDVAKTAMNGAQVASLLQTIGEVASRKIPRGAGVAALEKAFQVTTEEAERLLDKAGVTFFSDEPTE